MYQKSSESFSLFFYLKISIHGPIKQYSHFFNVRFKKMMTRLLLYTGCPKQLLNPYQIGPAEGFKRSLGHTNMVGIIFPPCLDMVGIICLPWLESSNHLFEKKSHLCNVKPGVGRLGSFASTFYFRRNMGVPRKWANRQGWVLIVIKNDLIRKNNK